MTDKKTNLIGIETDFIQDNENVIRKQTQDIPQWHLDALARERNASRGQREGELMRVASIPNVVVEKWMKEGFDILKDQNITGRQILKRLRDENLDAFITTEKSI